MGKKGAESSRQLGMAELGSLCLLFLGVIKVRNCGCFPLTHHLESDLDHGKLMRPAEGRSTGFRTRGQLLRHRDVVQGVGLQPGVSCVTRGPAPLRPRENLPFPLVSFKGIPWFLWFPLRESLGLGSGTWNDERKPLWRVQLRHSRLSAALTGNAMRVDES